ncbi:thioredoxin family protein [Capnocytophaga canis]|uniref:thioredoxin family protein n=1 Tax=Capnocytophaga canis TaxID=1848903 RepID=UPI0037D62751
MTKRIFAIVALMVGTLTTISAQEINWMSFDEALVAQKKNPKKIFVDVYTNWCGPCKYLDKTTFKNKDLVEYMNKNFYAVKFNAEGNDVVNYKGQKFENQGYDASKAQTRNSQHSFAGYLQVNAYPTMIFFDDNGEYILPVQGGMPATQLEIFLKLVANNDYKNIKTRADFQEYQSNFKGTFKE